MYILGFIPIPRTLFIPLFTLVSRILRTPILIHFYLANVFCVSSSPLALPCFSPTFVFPLCFCLYLLQFSSVQLLSRVQLCDPMNCSMPGLPVHHQLQEFTQAHVHWGGDACWAPPPRFWCSRSGVGGSGWFAFLRSPGDTDDPGMGATLWEPLV